MVAPAKRAWKFIMTEKLFENIYRIGVPLPNNPLRELNSYFVRGNPGEKDLLIDTGFRMPECRAALKEGLNELGADMDNLNIFLTHCHADHAGLAPEFVAGDGFIYIGAIDRPYVQDMNFMGDLWVKMGETYLEHGFPKKTVDMMIKINPAIAYAPKDGFAGYRNAAEGDILSCGGYHFECIFTPGHTPGHMCLWEEAHKIMILGDAILFDITPNITNWTTVEDSLGDYLKTLEKLKAFPVRYALPAHRKTGDYQARIRAIEKHHQVRLNEAASIIEKEPGLPAYDITARMQWNIHAKDWDSFPDAQKYFAVGEAVAHLTHLELQGKVQSKKEKGTIRFYPVR